jgi:hypothetical protein
MSNPSNLYAEKVFSEHPLSLWSLDDKIDYVSLISEAQRNLATGWTITGATATTSSEISGQPFRSSAITKLEGSVPSGATASIIAKGPSLINFDDMSNDLGTFSVGCYVYVQSLNAQSISIGYEYVNLASETVQELKTFNVSLFNRWVFVSETFDVKVGSAVIKPVIKIISNAGGTQTSDYVYYVNGLTVGQWAEEFNVTSLGVTPIDTPAGIAIEQTGGIATPSYGSFSDYGYYLSSNINYGSLLAKNSSFPLVFGSSNSTCLFPGPVGSPSLIFPGKGFLNNTGKYKDYTVEFWTRITCDSLTAKKIFGPISSSDGIYVEGGFITIVVGDNFGSYFVGEWFRPMLVDFKVIKDSASLLINGEEVISLSYKTEDLDLPEEYDVDGKNQDWLAFYSFADVTPIHVDCFGIYPYSVAPTVAKRRFVYGQGVGSQENTNLSYGGTSSFIDYTFADYTSNYNYPDYASWQQGTFDNLSTTASSITTPDYKLPEIFLQSKTIKNLYDDNKIIQDEDNNFITFRPNSSWNSKQCYLNFSNFDVLSDEVHAIYAVIKINEDDLTEQTIIEIKNKVNANRFSIRKNGANIDYYLTYNGVEEEILMGQEFTVGTKFAVGIDIESIVSEFGGNVASFFGNRNGLTIYFGGDDSGQRTFTGYLYSLGFSTLFNKTQIADHFLTNGTADIDAGDELLSHTASYTILPLMDYGKFFLDIGVSGYWEDYVPLSYFAQYVKDSSGEDFYEIDFLQFNIGYPSPSQLTERETTSVWTYSDLYSDYKNPTQKTYAQIDDKFYTGWNDYEDLSQKSIKYYEYDTSAANIQSYITFQYIENGSNLLDNNFVNTVKADQSRIVDLDNHTNWSTTKFQVVDNTIIYPTKTVDFNELAVVLHLNLSVRGILTKQLKLKKVQFASQAFNDNSFNPIGTRFGTNIFPYKKSGIYYDYKSKNPFSIYKDNTPYLYMSRNSGIEVRGTDTSDRGISMPVNENKASSYKIGAMQLWTRYDGDKFPISPTKIFEIDYKTDAIQFYMIADGNSRKRARVYAINKNTGEEFSGLSYYVNGLLVREPVITVKEWSVLGVGFSSDINFDSKLGNINLSGPMIFNNITYYQSNSLQQVQSILPRPWAKVKSDNNVNLDWEYWDNSFSWNGMLVLGTYDVYGVDPGYVYRAYVGTNKTIFDDSYGLSVNPDKINIYSAINWSTNTTSAV